MFNDVIVLIKTEPIKGANGYSEPIEKERVEVYAGKRSVHQSEHYNAAAQNIKLDIVFEVNTFEYDGQTLIEYGEGQKYKVVRAYSREKDDITELVCTRIESR